MSTVINQQDQIDVFINESGTITIRAIVPFDDDHIICVSKENADALCSAIQNAAKELREDNKKA
jgi:hypothetical protein